MCLSLGRVSAVLCKNQIKNQADSRDNEVFKDRLMVHRGSCVE